MNSFKITAKSKDFGYAVKLLKKRGGGEYDANNKTWNVEESTANALRQYPEYYTEVSISDSVFVTDVNGNVDLVS